MFEHAAANVTLMVVDVNESVRFYTDLLGLELTLQHGDHWAEVRAPGVTIGLHPGRSPESSATNDAMSIGFVVEDFDLILAQLDAQGITPRVTNTARARSAYFTDPDGHTLYAMWRAPIG